MSAPIRDPGLRSRRKAVTAACIGNFIEYYDFVIYAYFAVVISRLFFPAENEAASLMLTFTAFAVSYLVRPLGAVIFGAIGDKYGRRAPLMIAIMLIAGCTTAIGLMPTYESIGLAAPIMLTLLRMLQGVSVGGEYGGALAYIAEYAPDKRRGFYTAWQTFTIGLALLVGASVAAFLTNTLSTSALEAWGWRLPFLVGLPLGFVGLYIRLKLEDTPQFNELKERLGVAKAPLRDGISQWWRKILIGFGIMATPSLCIYIYFMYLPTYLSSVLDYDGGTGQMINLLGLAFYCALIPIFGFITDRVGRRPMLLLGAVCVLVLTYPGFMLLNSGHAALATAGLCMMGLGFAPISAASLVSLAESFPTSFRYSGVSISLQIPVTALGGAAPLMATALIAGTGDVHSPAFLVMGGAACSIVAALIFRETVGRDLYDVDKDVPDRQSAPDTTSTSTH